MVRGPALQRWANLDEGSRQLLVALYRFAVLTTALAGALALPLGEQAGARSRLRALWEGGLVSRTWHARPGWGRRALWSLTAQGARAAAHLVGRSGERGRETRVAVAAVALPHTLGVAAVCAAVRRRALAQGEDFGVFTGADAAISVRGVAGRTRVVPDALLAVGPQPWCLEYDRGTMGDAAMRRKFLAYREVQDVTESPLRLVVAAEQPARRERLRRLAEEVGLAAQVLAPEEVAGAVVPEETEQGIGPGEAKQSQLAPGCSRGKGVLR